MAVNTQQRCCQAPLLPSLFPLLTHVPNFLIRTVISVALGVLLPSDVEPGVSQWELTWRLMSLTTPVHLLTPQGVNGFGGDRERDCHSGTTCKHTTGCPHFPVSHHSHADYSKALFFWLVGARGFVREGGTGGVKYPRWEISLKCHGQMIMSFCQASLWGLQ